MTATAEKTRRVKRVVTTDMVAHKWAHQTQSDARNAQGNFYFRDSTIYSYGGHFPIATHVTHRGKSCVLFTTRRYSATTAGHKSTVRRACLHLTVFTVPVLNRDNDANFKHYQQQIDEIAKRCVMATQQDYTGELDMMVAEANAYAEFFGYKKRFEAPLLDRRKIRQQAVEATAKRLAKADADRKRRDKQWAEHDKKQQEILAAWLAGTSDQCPSLYGEFVRCRIKGSRIQTTNGAIVPLADALKLLVQVRSGVEYQRTSFDPTTLEPGNNTLKLGEFELNEINKEFVRIGCTKIRIEEIERLAATIGK